MTTTTAERTIEELAATYGDAWNSQDLEAILALHTEDSTFQLFSGGEPAVGKDAVRDAFAQLLAQFPDIHFAERRLITGEGHWVLESTVTATLAAALEVEGETIAPESQKVEFDAVDVITVEDGLVKTKATYLDALAIQRQLGVDG